MFFSQFYVAVIQVRGLTSYTTRFIPIFLHKNILVPSQNNSSCYPFVFGFTIWLGTFQLWIFSGVWYFLYFLFRHPTAFVHFFSSQQKNLAGKVKIIKHLFAPLHIYSLKFDISFRQLYIQKEYADLKTILLNVCFAEVVYRCFWYPPVLIFMLIFHKKKYKAELACCRELHICMKYILM